MNHPSHNKNLIFIIVALLLTNIAVLAYFLWLKKPEPVRPPERKGIMIELLQKEVGFDTVKMEQYKQLKDEQRETVRPLFDEMRKAKENFFKLISDPGANDSVINKAADAIAQQQKALDLQTFNHFKKVRALCETPEQQVKYDSAVVKMFRKMGRSPRHNDSDKEKAKSN